MHTEYKYLSGVILAGGKSRRMGRPKAFLEIHGKRIIDIIIDAFRKCFDEIIIVTDNKDRFKEFKQVKVIEDEIKGCGPLGGIYTGLKNISHENAFFIACDMPFLHIGLIDQQIRRFNELNCDCCVPRIGGFIEPLHAVYKKKLKDDISRFIKSNTSYSVKSFLQKTAVCYLDLKDNVFIKKAFRNLNTQEDLKEVIKDEDEN